jgi:hypothetical protein
MGHRMAAPAYCPLIVANVRSHMRLYYLTGAEFALSNIALRRVRISRFADLNDPFELLAVNLRDKEHRKAFRATKDEINRKNGLICLSRSWANPLMWGHYGAKHTGVGLGFDVPDHIPAEVIYASSPETIPLDKTTGLPVLDGKLMRRLLRTKFHDWKYEDEMRIFVGLDARTVQAGSYFYDFSDDFQLREVILGPNCGLPIEGVRRLVAGYQPQITVTKARIAFGSFEVVENLAYREEAI